MSVYVVLLRAINVARHQRVSMADLRNTIEAAGFEDVATHIQTGNVIVSSKLGSADAVGRAIERAMGKELGLRSDAMVRTPRELAAILRSNPFLEGGADASGLYVGFLKTKPSAAAVKSVADRTFGDDEFAIRGREIYLRYADGLGRSKMSVGLFERWLEIPATVRNWNVVTKLRELSRDG